MGNNPHSGCNALISELKASSDQLTKENQLLSQELIMAKKIINLQKSKLDAIDDLFLQLHSLIINNDVYEAAKIIQETYQAIHPKGGNYES